MARHVLLRLRNFSWEESWQWSIGVRRPGGMREALARACRNLANRLDGNSSITLCICTTPELTDLEVQGLVTRGINAMGELCGELLRAKAIDLALRKGRPELFEEEGDDGQGG